MAKAKATSKHSKQHRGVALIKSIPELRIGWRARWKDPDNPDKLVTRTLPADAARTEDTRAKWATAKAQELAERKLDLDRGAPRAKGTPLSKAIEDYFEDNQDLLPKTLIGYRAAVAKLERWATKSNVHTLDDITHERLMGLRKQIKNEPKHTTAKGGKRGARIIVGAARRSPYSVNRELAALRTITGYWCDHRMLAKVRKEDLGIAFKKQRATTEAPTYLEPAEIRAVLNAALKHDAATFKATRSEHAGKGHKGATPKYDPVAPLIAVALLTGMRLGEVLRLDWDQINLDAAGIDGVPVGEIKLKGSATKTKKPRTIGLVVSPALRDLLRAMRGDRKTGKVFPLTDGAAEKIVERLKRDFGVPQKFGWQVLRSTCSTYLSSAGGIYGGASAFKSAKQLGHSVQVAVKHYAESIDGISRDARTLEAAMQIEDAMRQIVTVRT